MKNLISLIVHLGTVAFLLAVGLAAPAQVAHATTGAVITVNSNADAEVLDGICTLREAITATQFNMNYYGCVNTGGPYGDDLIQFAIAGSTTITLGAGFPTLTGATMTIDGSNSGNPVTIDGAGAYRPFFVNTGETLTLIDITVQNGSAGLSDTGGGVLNLGGLVVLRSTFQNNSSGQGGGAIDNGGNLNISNSTFTGNSSTYGGAVDNNSGTAVILNSTFSGNTASIDGGALATFKGSTAYPVTTIYNTIMANSSAPTDCYRIGTLAELGTLTGSNNLIETTGGAADCSGVTSSTSDPQLGALTGSPAYFPLLAGSPAIDAGDDATCALIGVDERGSTRTRGPHCDIGAYERIPAHASLGNGYQTDVGVFRPSTGAWLVKGVLATSYGLSGDDPLPFDFDGDGQAEVAVYRPSAAGWYVQGQSAAIYGLPSDVPVPGDYNGDRIADIAVFRRSTSSWYIKNQMATVYGLSGDIPVPGDYNGDGTTDIAVYRPSTSAWYIRGQTAAIYGLVGDIPVPADYDGNGTTDIAVFRPSTSAWYIRGQTSAIYGVSGDIPVPGDYNGDGTADIAVYRPSTSGWYVKGQSATIYGLFGDYPLPAPDTNADGDPYQ